MSFITNPISEKILEQIEDAYKSKTGLNASQINEIRELSESIQIEINRLFIHTDILHFVADVIYRLYQDKDNQDFDKICRQNFESLSKKMSDIGDETSVVVQTLANVNEWLNRSRPITPSKLSVIFNGYFYLSVDQVKHAGYIHLYSKYLPALDEDNVSLYNKMAQSLAAMKILEGIYKRSDVLLMETNIDALFGIDRYIEIVRESEALHGMKL